MAILNIRNLPADVHARLRVRAARVGRSMEAEARAILADAVRSEGVPLEAAVLVQNWVSELYEQRKPHKVVDRLLAERRREAKREGRAEPEAPEDEGRPVRTTRRGTRK